MANSGFSKIATNLIASLGYGGLAVGLVVDSAGIPIPSEVLLPLAGALARQGRMNVAVIIVVGTLAQTAGAALAYGLGMGPGLELVKRYGKYVLFSERELAKTTKLFEKWGQWLTLAGRCLPGIRTYIGYPAGIARMNFGKFIGASFIGSLGWTTVLTLLGYELASKLDVIDGLLSKFGYGLLAVTVLALGYYLYKRRTREG